MLLAPLALAGDHVVAGRAGPQLVWTVPDDWVYADDFSWSDVTARTTGLEVQVHVHWDPADASRTVEQRLADRVATLPRATCGDVAVVVSPLATLTMRGCHAHYGPIETPVTEGVWTAGGFDYWVEIRTDGPITQDQLAELRSVLTSLRAVPDDVGETSRTATSTSGGTGATSTSGGTGATSAKGGTGAPTRSVGSE